MYIKKIVVITQQKSESTTDNINHKQPQIRKTYVRSQTMNNEQHMV